MVRVAAIRRASARMVSAGTPVIGEAQSASFGWPSVSPIRYGSTRSKPMQYLARNASVVPPLADQRMRQRQQHRRVGIRPDRDPFGPNRLRPVVADRADVDDLDAGARQLRQSSRWCNARAQPPLLTCVFFGLAPPNSTISRYAARSRTTRSADRRPPARLPSDVRQERQRRAEAVVA